MRQQVDEGVLRERRIGGREIDDVGHAVLLEDAQRVVAEALVEVGQLALGRGVGAQLEDLGRDCAETMPRRGPAKAPARSRRPRNRTDGREQAWLSWAPAGEIQPIADGAEGPV